MNVVVLFKVPPVIDVVVLFKVTLVRAAFVSRGCGVEHGEAGGLVV